MRCPLIYKADLIRYVHSLNKDIPISKIRRMKKRQLYAIWFSKQRQ